MGARKVFKTGLVGVFLLGFVVLGPAPASATNMWWQQAIFLVQVPLGGGQVFTANYVFTANEGANTTVNVKCFNDTFQRIGPAAGVNVELSATGQVANHTPTTLLVTTDPLFTGLGWCWANNINSGLDFNVQTTVGSTSDLTPGGLLNSLGSTVLGTSTGLAETSNDVGGIPFFSTVGGASAFAILLNPLPGSRSVTLQLFNATGVAQGDPLVRNLSGRDLDVMQIPQVFGLTTPPTTGSVKITTGGNGYLGWIIQVYPTSGGRLLFTPIGLDGDNAVLLSPADAP